MSDYNPFLEGDDGPLEGSPDDVGVAADDGQPTEQPAYEAPRDYLDIDAYGDHVARVKVDGQELEVPLREALQGYSRTADYTRKTQELASQRQEAEYALTVQRALQAQPEETLRLLARQHGINWQSPPATPGAPSTTDEGQEDLYADPIERRLNQQQRLIDQMVQRDEQRRADEVLRTAIGGLQQRYQADEPTVREVISQALQSNLGPESFDMIYRSIAFERAQQARAQAQQQRQESEAQRQQAGLRASQLVGNGSSANGAGGPLQPNTSDGHLSIAEAFEAAEREHGVRF